MGSPTPQDPTTDTSAPPPEDASRPLTIDDVPRLGSGTGVAVGCAVIVIAAILVFWFVRGWVMPGF